VSDGPLCLFDAAVGLVVFPDELCPDPELFGCLRGPGLGPFEIANDTFTVCIIVRISALRLQM